MAFGGVELEKATQGLFGSLAGEPGSCLSLGSPHDPSRRLVSSSENYIKTMDFNLLLSIIHSTITVFHSQSFHPSIF